MLFPHSLYKLNHLLRVYFIKLVLCIPSLEIPLCAFANLVAQIKPSTYGRPNFMSTSGSFKMLSMSSTLFVQPHQDLSAYSGLMITVGIATGLCIAMGGIAYLLSLSMARDAQQLSEYECGFEPFDSATRLPFDVHFYLVGVLFLIFDVEIALIFPWVFGLESTGYFSFYLMLFFVLLLGLGFLYEWRRGALIWPTQQHGFPFLLLAPEISILLTLCLIIIGVAAHVQRTKHPVLALHGRRWAMGGLLLAALLYIPLLALPPALCCQEYLLISPLITAMKILVVFSGWFILNRSKLYIEEHRRHLYEYPVILLLATLFMVLLLSSNHLLAAFLSLVGFSLNLYVLILFDSHRQGAREAGIKYYYLSAFSSGLILYGIFLLFMSAQTLYLHELIQLPVTPALIFAVTLMLLGLFFKLAVAPAHLWTAEVYEGSPDPITGLFMLSVKISVLGFVLITFAGALDNLVAIWQPVLAVGAALSMVIGCFGALYERKIKRFLAYASINQMGFLLLGLASGTFEGYRATVFYLFVYVLMNVGFLIPFLSLRRPDRLSFIYLTDFRGLGASHRFLSWGLTVILFSMAGIPPLAGFYGKYYLLIHVQEQSLYGLFWLGIATSLVSTAYYLRIIRMIWFEKSEKVFPAYGNVPLNMQILLYVIEALLIGAPLIVGLTLIVSDSIMVHGLTNNIFMPFSYEDKLQHMFNITTEGEVLSMLTLQAWSFLLSKRLFQKREEFKRLYLEPVKRALEESVIGVIRSDHIKRSTAPLQQNGWPIEAIGIFSALFAIRSANPIVALLYLIVTFVMVIGLLIINHSEFLGYLFLIIYIGAIAILFLFVIMMFNLKETTVQQSPFTFTSILLLLFFKFNFVVHAPFFEYYLEPFYTADHSSLFHYVSYSFADILAFSQLLYTEHGYLFVLVGLLLLTAMLGAIVLAMGTVEKPVARQ